MIPRSAISPNVRAGSPAVGAMSHVLPVFLGLLAQIIPVPTVRAQADTLRIAEEKHLRNVRQLTFGGENAEAYFSFDESRLVFQSTRDSFTCDQIFTMNLEGKEQKLVSTGRGRTTCSYFLPDGAAIIYSSTHHRNPACPPPPDYSKGYIWAINRDYDIFTVDLSTRRHIQLTSTPGYDAEATVSPRGDRIVFTSTRDGDLDIYSMRTDGGDLRRLTDEPGYDGGAFFSWNGSRIVYRADHPSDSLRMEDYRSLLARGFVRPSVMEIFVMNSDGSDKRGITSYGAASFAPFFHPDNLRIIFASNMHDPKGRNFDLYLIRDDGTGLERITFNDTFDGFPVFTRDGKKLVFASNRNAKVRGETNIFIAEWVE